MSIKMGSTNIGGIRTYNNTGLKYGDSLVLDVGSCNYFDDTLYVDYSQGLLKRLSLWSKENLVPVKMYISGSNKDTVNENLSLISIPNGKTILDVLCCISCQISINEFNVQNNVLVSRIIGSGWLNITGGTTFSYNLDSSANAIGISFRKNSNNDAFGSGTFPYIVSIDFR